ncbi:MAG: transposase [Chrysiogenetes bacterium]|nr:transposase [Chrysiogenetes bacterium]
MSVSAQRRQRRSIRLRGYDYTRAGAYFLTICARGRECLFGEVAEGTVRLSDSGRAVEAAWHGLPEHYPHVDLDAFVVMPNHVHGIIVLSDPDVGAGLKPAPTENAVVEMDRAGLKPAPTGTHHGLPEIVRAFKTFSARRINALRGTPGVPVWQRNYYEHIVRDDDDLARIREYIANNPIGWGGDRENPANAGRVERFPDEDAP